MLNYLWLGLILFAVFLAGWTGDFSGLVTAAFDSARNAVMVIALPLAGLMALWLGMMRLAEKAGLVAVVARALRPMLVRLFPDVPKDHPAMGSMVMNMAANMLGLSNAATPLGLRAMQDLEKINPHPGTASNAMCTFLAINTSSVQLIPATAVAILAANGATQPTAIIGTAFTATLCSTIAGLVAVKSLERLPGYALPPPQPERAAEIEKELKARETMERPEPLRKSAIFFLLLFALGFFVIGFRVASGIFEEQPALFAAIVQTVSLLAIPFLFAFFPLFACLRGIPVYEEFVEGAKEGLQVAFRIIPFLVAILVAIGMFREAGGIDILKLWLGGILSALGIPTEVFPLMLVRPLSGSGALGIFTEIAQTHGGDSFVARMAGTIMGSTETTFYVIAVYFGSVAVRRTRHAVPAGLIADFTGMVAAVTVCNLVFLR